MTGFKEKCIYREGTVRGWVVTSYGEVSYGNVRNELRKYAVIPNQTHSTDIVIVDRDSKGIIHDADAILTFENDLPIGVVTADCVPIIVNASDIGSVAAIHAGWKGTLNGIVDKICDFLKENGSDLSKIEVVFGPSIDVVNYEVDKDLAKRFVDAGFGEFVKYYEDGGKPHLDLQGINACRFRKHGVEDGNMRLSKESTFSSIDNDGRFKYPSYRRDHGTENRLLTYIEIPQA